MAAHSEHDTEHHIIPIETYLKVFGILIVLTIITVAVTRVDFGAFNAVVAFGIASIKAGLVLAYFMHLKYDNVMNRVIIASSVFFLIVLWFFVIVDEMSRFIERSTL